MNHRQLADQAVKAAAREGEFLSPGIVERLRRGHVAEWLFRQDEAHLPAAALTAVRALAVLVAYENQARTAT